MSHVALPEICLINDVTDITPNDLLMRNVGLIGLDVENILTDYKDSVVRPEVKEHLGMLASTVVNLEFILLSNSTDAGFMEEVAAQLNKTEFLHKNGSLAGKTKPEMFEAALAMFHEHMFDEDSRRLYSAVHVDDQWKSFFGVASANWNTFFWSLPYGQKQHPGVRLARPAERLLRAGISRI